ncbi:fungal-specific transcription factor domain-containing protein [Linnemannia elongata]|nr:fungal-specific transcription factor domain-containing protein [Linnemannia elongata]
MQTTTAGNRDYRHSGSSLTLSNSKNNNDDAESKRRKTTQACDYCRQKRAKCDNAKPRCHQCAKAGTLCTFFTHSKKRGPIPREELDPETRQSCIDYASGRHLVKPKPTRNIGPLQLTHYRSLRPHFNTFRNFYPLHHSYFGNPNQSDDPMRRLTEEGHTPSIETSSIRPASARGDLWRKELTDHLVEVFFEHCFQDFDNFDPKEFLKDYAERKINPSLLNAICAVAARFSDHPDIIQVPPYLSGEPYAEKTREKIMDLIDEATISNLHALFILSFYEYSSWRGPRGWRFGGLASRMGIELYLHNQRDIPTSEAARVKFETKCRTFWSLIHIDIFSAASAGLPSILDFKLYNIQLPDYRSDWWVEKNQDLRVAIIGEVEEDGDLQETISTQPETTPIDPFTVRILAKLQQTRRLRGHGPAKYLFEPIELLFRVSQYINGNTLESDKCPSDPSSEFAVLEGRLLTWITTIEEEVPLTRKELVESEENVAYIILTYYMTVIMLHRPIIALELVDTSFVDQSRVRCAEAATKITDIVEQFNEIDIKYRGHLFVFQVFTGATIHVTNIFTLDDALAANAKRCLNVHLNFLKVSSPYWTVSARLYFILQDLYSAQETVDVQSDSSTLTSAAATPQNKSGSESRSDRASSSGAGHSP